MTISTRKLLFFTLCFFTLVSSEAQVGRKPVLRFFVPSFPNPFDGKYPTTFAVSAYDLGGDSLTFTWRTDAHFIKRGRDTDYVRITPFDPNEFSLFCTFATSTGPADSVIWALRLPIGDGIKRLPDQPLVFQNYPNPFNPSTTIFYQLLSDSHVSLKAYDARGNLVAILVDRRQSTGTHRLSWTPKLSSGTYYMQIIAGPNILTRKAVLIK